MHGQCLLAKTPLEITAVNCYIREAEMCLADSMVAQEFAGIHAGFLVA